MVLEAQDVSNSHSSGRCCEDVPTQLNATDPRDLNDRSNHLQPWFVGIVGPQGPGRQMRNRILNSQLAMKAVRSTEALQ